MTSREQLIAYLATLFALVFVFVAALVAATNSIIVMGKLEVFGMGTITGGLIGLLRIPASRNPGGTTVTGDVNVKGDE